jgi:DNA modification methylase
LDICSGSGTMGMSVMFGREYIGIEISKQYHKTANERLEYFTNKIDEKEIEEFESLVLAA